MKQNGENGFQIQICNDKVTDIQNDFFYLKNGKNHLYLYFFVYKITKSMYLIKHYQK